MPWSDRDAKDGAGRGARAIATIVYYSGFVAMALTALLAFWRGGALEKHIAAVVAIAWIASALVPLGDRSDPAWMLIGIDVVLAVYLLYQAAFSRRRWPVGAAAFALLIVANHFVFVRRPELDQWPYFTAYYLWSWGVLACIVVGTLRTPRHDAA